jgi:hypothetical protein
MCSSLFRFAELAAIGPRVQGKKLEVVFVDKKLPVQDNAIIDKVKRGGGNCSGESARSPSQRYPWT